MINIMDCIQYNYCYHLPSVYTVYCSMSILYTAPCSRLIGQPLFFTMSSLSLDLLALDTTPCINGYFSYATHIEFNLDSRVKYLPKLSIERWMDDPNSNKPN